MTSSIADRGAAPLPTWAVATAGLLALAVAMGIGRFAFTPLLPLMMRDGLLDADGGALLAAANYAGYLVGALSATRISRQPLRLARWSLPAIALLTAAAAWAPGLAPWLVWRFAAGVGSAWVMVGTSSWVLMELARRGRSGAAAWVFSGVGLGIALAGAWAWAQAGAGSAALWQALGALALALSLVVMVLTRSAAISSLPAPTPPVHRSPGRAGLVLCYGSLGFGYILPATYLPALARTLIDDPHLFGLAWPVFGLAAAASTVLAGRALARWRLQDVWAVCHLTMALGTALPLLGRSGLAIAASALLVGGTFVVATMAGLQQARALAPSDPTELLGRMTAAFALGQIAGPLVALALARVQAAGLTGIELTLALATALLCATAGWLWRADFTAPAAAGRDAAQMS